MINSVILVNKVFCGKRTSCLDCKERCINKKLIVELMKKGEKIC